MADTLVLAKYLRLSDDDGRYGESQSIEGQRDILDSYIASCPDLCGAKILEFSDDGYTGTNFNRPGVTELLKKVKRGEIHGILVKDFSRFGRSYIEVGDYLEQIFPFLRVRFISVNDGFDSARQECSAGDVSVAFKSLCNDYYSKDLSRKVRSGIAALRDGGKYHASTAPFGYLKDSEDIHRIVVDPEAAAVVRRVYEMALGGMGAKMIAKTLNAENIMTPGRYKLERTGRKVGYNTNNVWTGGAVRAILKDVRYTGLLVQGMTRCSVVGDNRHHLVPREQWHVSPTRHEAIVSEEKYEAVQSLIRSPKSTVKPPHTVHPLSRKVRCGGCGHVMSRSNAKNPAYLCGYKAFYTDGDCPRKGVKVSAVEETVLAALRGLYTAFAATEKRLRSRDEKQTMAAMERMKDIQAIERQINAIENDKLAFYTRFCDGDMEKEGYLRLRDDADKKLQGLTEQLRAMELSMNKKPKATISDPLHDALCDLPLDDGLTREIVVALIDRVIIYGKDRIEIKWTFSDAALITGMEEQKLIEAGAVLIATDGPSMDSDL